MSSQSQQPTPARFLKSTGAGTALVGKMVGLLAGRPALNTYFEPFVGAGAMFFSLKERGLIHSAVLADERPGFAETLTAVRDSVDDVVAELDTLRDTSPGAYYEVRSRYNADRGRRDPRQAARFIFLNRVGYNGLYRQNRRGEFNVPAGRYLRPRVFDAGTLRRASRLLQNAEILANGDDQLVSKASSGDLVYCDPSPLVRRVGAESLASQAKLQSMRARLVQARDRGALVAIAACDDVRGRAPVGLLARAWRAEILTPAGIDAIASESIVTVIPPELVAALTYSAHDVHAYVSRHPEVLSALGWREFEFLLESVFKAHGIHTLLGPGRADKGVDLRLVEHGIGGQFITLVQAKKYAKHLPVKLHYVQSLWAAVGTENAHRGLMVTTSYYEPGTLSWADEQQHRLTLAGPDDVRRWCEVASSVGRGRDRDP